MRADDRPSRVLGRILLLLWGVFWVQGALFSLVVGVLSGALVETVFDLDDGTGSAGIGAVDIFLMVGAGLVGLPVGLVLWACVWQVVGKVIWWVATRVLWAPIRWLFA